MTDADQPEHVVDVYADVSCPFAHFSLRRFTERRHRAGADIGEAFNLAIREALFEQGRAIGDPDVLGEIAARFDLVVPDAASARAAVDADFVEGQRRGVTGSPYFIVGGAPFFCPTLDIERQGEHLRIDIDDAELDRFIDRALQ
ncbi:MAG TPA: hypothetical protein VFD59_14625 [Nocardioidaceae bacterium]|nr:hypothetical protein [Nocardioidaceae bacterium]